MSSRGQGTKASRGGKLGCTFEHKRTPFNMDNNIFSLTSRIMLHYSRGGGLKPENGDRAPWTSHLSTAFVRVYCHSVSTARPSCVHAVSSSPPCSTPRTSRHLDDTAHPPSHTVPVSRSLQPVMPSHRLKS